MDLIEKQAAIKTLEKGLPSEPLKSKYTEGITVGFGLAITWIEQLPAAQPEIIRCKECKHSEHWYRDKRRCFLWVEDGIDVFDDGFCNYADKRGTE